MICPSQYTFMLQNLPSTVNEGALSKWVEDLGGEKPLKINLSYDLTVNESAYAKKEELSFRMNEYKVENSKIQLSVPFDKDKVEKNNDKID